jgi:type I restriction enzyme S subunit
MGVKVSYKQTEVGVIPGQWDHVLLDSIANRGSGHTPDKKHPEYWNGSIKWISLADSPDLDRVYIDDTFAKVTPAGITNSSAVVHPAGTVVLSRDAGVGKSAIMRTEMAVSQHFMAWTCGPELNNHYLYYWLQANKQEFERIASGNTIKTIGLPYFKDLKLPKPDLPEQTAIAEALGSADALLGGLDRLIAKKRGLKQAAMQQLLTGQTRLPGFAPPNSQFTKTTVGVFPEDWKLVQLSDLVDPARGIRYGIVQPGDYDPEGRYMIRGQDYSEVKGWAQPSEVFRVSAGIEERYRNARVKTGDLIMTIVGYCGYVEMIPDWLDGANLTQTTARIAVQPEMAVSAYCKYALLSPIGGNQVAAYLKGAAQPGLNCGDVEQFLLPLPGTPEQTAIAEVLTEMDEELAALEQRREKTRALKQAMMHELLTGKTRLV